MKLKIITALCLILTASKAMDIHVFSGIEWSTNSGASWQNDTSTNDIVELIDGDFPVTNSVQFFRAKSTSDGGTIPSGQVINAAFLFGNSTSGITNFITDAQFIVNPSRSVYGTNISYRPWITITNMDTNQIQLVCTNCTDGIDTNPPPLP